MSKKKHLISQENLDYNLPDNVYNIVKNELIIYADTLALARQNIDIVIEEKYNLYPTVNYGDVISHTTPGFYSKTAEIADRAGLDRIRIEDARRKVEGIQRGIKRAAYTSSRPNKRKKLRKDLEDHLLNKIQNRSSNAEKSKKCINRDPRSLRTYTERAYYFIAVELGYISINKEIQLAENQLNRIIGNE